MQKKHIKNVNFIAWIPERNKLYMKNSKPDSEFKSNETTNQTKLNKNTIWKARIKNPDHRNEVKQTLIAEFRKKWNLGVEEREMVWFGVELMFEK